MSAIPLLFFKIPIMIVVSHPGWVTRADPGPSTTISSSSASRTSRNQPDTSRHIHLPLPQETRTAQAVTHMWKLITVMMHLDAKLEGTGPELGGVAVMSNGHDKCNKYLSTTSTWRRWRPAASVYSHAMSPWSKCSSMWKRTLHTTSRNPCSRLGPQRSSSTAKNATYAETLTTSSSQMTLSPNPLLPVMLVY
eukprot:1014934-Rhodomonas_salina.1